ncbi:hypothetical protein SAMN02744037_01854 [Tepidibacter formicigenes DSM 15518]|uniref:Uncharacterized protein n=1 Tax=Tepidibacter formicigenes DSM 15518 TaxID=1123349 RepID=A0A1M6QIC4_9FIRM|nr:hypothetical protein SAMN02744037_01854 [Tepidibacter formicigenes DSM 15518]
MKFRVMGGRIQGERVNLFKITKKEIGYNFLFQYLEISNSIFFRNFCILVVSLIKCE